ncbi:MAG: hypothetical protein K0Q52_95 [Microbacterium sp.]|jgi:hypothetical protein|nr:hypothetical protein [Microbacterium sp.]
MSDAHVHALLETFGEAAAESPAVKEAFDRAMALLRREDQGYIAVYGAGGAQNLDSQFGLTLESLKEWGRKIRESVVAAPWMGAGFRRRYDYIWEGGIRYGNIPEPTRGKKNLQEVIDDPENQLHFFGDDARRAREECLYAEGIAFWIGHKGTKSIEAIPLRQITDHLLQPSGLGYAWAYKREWSEVDLATGETKEQVRWYFTDRFEKRRVKEIVPKGGGDPIPVDQDHVIFDMIANGSTGLVYGAPDALAAWVWNGIARDATMDGRAMTQALATFALKASVKSKEGEKNTSLQLATPHGAGSTAVLGQANDLVPLSTAGKGYDFSPLNFLTAIVATSLDIPAIHLTANPDESGSGASQALDLPTRLAMEARRREHIALDKRVLTWMGVTKPDVTFAPFSSGDQIYRQVQALVLQLDKGAIDIQEFRDALDDLYARPNGKAPKTSERADVLLAKEMAKIEKANAPTPAPAADGAALPQVASPNQGRSNGTGGQDGGNASNDIRRE